MRLVFLDTETTGMNKSRNGEVNDGHRIIEIGAVEMVDGVLTGNIFHEYYNPGVAVDVKASLIHGISDDDLKGRPTFDKSADRLLEFLRNGVVVMHNAKFDMAFLDGEIGKLKKKPDDVFYYIDTLQVARNLFPGADNTLNGLALRFGCADTDTLKGFHGALGDAYLLAQVYPYLMR